MGSEMCIRDSTERLCAEVLSLPIFPELTEAQQEKVIDTLRNLLLQPKSLQMIG